MGASQSKAKFLINPEEYATQVKQAHASTQVKEYDFVIIGGGTAGCVLAARLSENPAFTVLVIEAGKSHEGNLFSKIPMGFSKLFLSDADWAFYTSPQKQLYNRAVFCPRGKILGGSSSINGLVYHHASPSGKQRIPIILTSDGKSPADYDEWERNGAEGWSYKDLRPYFLKAECFTPTASHPEIRADEHGTSGPWKIRGPDSSVRKHVLRLAGMLAFPAPDFNTPRGTMGAATCAAFIDSKGHRSSAATAYLTDDVLKRPNLSVAVNCCVEKILFDNENGKPRAIGVELRTARNAALFRVSARKEVILSAGAYGTPHLLMVSGVGPREQLEEKEICVVKDLPAVGKNLVDHPSCGSVVFRTKGAPTNDYLNKPLSALFALVQWLTTGKGPMATLAAPGAAFIRSDDTSLPFTSTGKSIPDLGDVTSGPNSPDLELVWIPLIVLDGGVGKTPSGVCGITMSVVCLRPQSTGEITLKTNNIWDKPIVDPKWFSNERDMHAVLRGMRLLFKIARTEPLASLTDLHENYTYPFLWPGSANPDTITDEELQDFVRKNASPAWHPACTARMGKSEDSSVVNTKLQVHGVGSLRVVDVSVFPNQLSGHLCAAVVAIAEKASDMIKEAYSGL